MKLAEALLQRSEYQTKLENLQTRILANIKVQENEKPHEDPNALLAESFELDDKLCALIKQINRCNNATALDDGRTLAQALTDRDALLKKRNLLAAVTTAASEQNFRVTRSEIKTTVTVDVGTLQKQIDDLSKQFRELDTKIQSANWLTELA